MGMKSIITSLLFNCIKKYPATSTKVFGIKYNKSRQK